LSGSAAERQKRNGPPRFLRLRAAGSLLKLAEGAGGLPC